LASAKSGQIWPEIWPEPNLAGFGKNGRISDLPKPKFGATLLYTGLDVYKNLISFVDIGESVLSDIRENVEWPRFLAQPVVRATSINS